MGKVIAITNQKGGIGKTTSSTALSAILSSRGYKTLLIDADPQGNSSDTFRAEIEGVATLYDVMVEGTSSIEEAIQHTEIGDVLASDDLLEEADARLEKKGISGYTMLKNAIDHLQQNEENAYDYIIIDTPPAINHILRNVLVAADEVILPMKVGRYSFQGINKLVAGINDAKTLNPNLKIAGVLRVEFDPRTHIGKDTSEALTQVSQALNTKVFDSYIRRDISVPEAQDERTTLLSYSKSCRAERDYEDFLEEYLGI